MTWDLFLIGYFLIGCVMTAIASIGHKERFGRSMHWGMKVAGVPLWPFVLLIGGRK